jgi:predicted metal-dependent HD superfamily phosphohydrolase
MTPFVELLESMGANIHKAGDYYAAEVGPRYAEKHRYYHTLRHILACLQVFDEVPLYDVTKVQAQTVQLALWMHDLIYDPRSGTNEEKSAQHLAHWGKWLGLQSSVIESACTAILATKHDCVARHPVSKIVVDVDLSILGAPEDVFDEYERQVRQEYDWAPDDAWLIGRKGALESFRKRERIYSTAEYITRFEEPARANLARSLRRLERGEVLRLEKKM